MLADKITQLRKKNGWSQEELANMMKISRQAVYKWESNQATPDIEKIIQLSSLFGVTIDSLLKEDGEHTPETCSQSQSASVQQDKVQTPSSLKPAIQITWNELKGPIMGAYWCILVAIYLFWSFTADSWEISWIVFVAGGILSSLVEGLCIFISNKRQG